MSTMDMMGMFSYYSQIGETVDIQKEFPNKKLYNLHKWCLCIKPATMGKIFPNFSMHVKGYKQEANKNDLFWTSSEITEIKGQRIVITKNSIYYLFNEINKEASLTAGFGKSFNEFFKNGFQDKWKDVVSVFANHILKKGATPEQISNQLLTRSMMKQFPTAQTFTRHKMTTVMRQKAELQEMIRKDTARQNRESKRRSGGSEDSGIPTKRKSLENKLIKRELVDDTWSKDDVEKLWSVVQQVKPCNDSDWDKVMVLIGQGHSLEEVKKKAEPMCVQFKNKPSPTTDLIKKIKKLTPNETLPKKGTIRRKTLENEMLKVIYCKKNKDDSALPELDNDSDDELLSESMINSCNLNGGDNSFDPKPVQYSLLVDSCRRQNDSGIEIGDDFSTPIRNPHRKYSICYYAKQFNRKKHPQDQNEYESEDDGLYNDSDFEEDSKDENEEAESNPLLTDSVNQ